METQAETEQSLSGSEGSMARERDERLLSEAQSENKCGSSCVAGGLVGEELLLRALKWRNVSKG